eukprot:1019410-Rhodomonas_salina.2
MVRKRHVSEGTHGHFDGHHHDDVTAISFSADAAILLSSCTDTTAKAWKTSSGGPATLTRTFVHPEPVSCISCSPIETCWTTCKVATVSGDGKLRIWNYVRSSSCTDTDQPGKVIACHDAVVWSCAFNPQKENQVSTASSDGMVKSWDIAHCKIRGAPFLGFVGHVQS